MATLGKKHKKVALITAAVMLGTAAAAFAYWTAGGSGTGTAATGDYVPITAVQTTAPAAMAPGDSAQLLAGSFTNSNPGPVWVTSVTASIASVVKATGAIGSCDATDYTLAGAVMPVGAEVPAGLAKGTWTGATIKFNNKASIQDGCKGAVVNLAYAIN